MPASADCIASSVCRVRVESLHMTRPGTQPKSASCAATCRGKKVHCHFGWDTHEDVMQHVFC